MKIAILSDLHLGVAPFDPPATDADVVVLAGDIARPREAVAWARRYDRPVVYVPGNHEFYGGSIDGVRAELQRLCDGTGVRLLDAGETVLDGVRFVGTTLWTDFRLYAGDPVAHAESLKVAQRMLRDFSRIRRAEASDELFAPGHAARLFAEQSAWLAARLTAPHDGPTVVVTHHAPSRRSIHPRFAGSPLNACFVSDADHLLDGRRAALWIHGHTHDSFDYDVNGTRVVCNPRGYAKDGVVENARFDPGFVATV
ncbi:MAG: metallophosphoesterase [Proteobacteria bacterium]|nr:metallophosphoesterase [Pseudomonadota bacterium]